MSSRAEKPLQYRPIATYVLALAVLALTGCYRHRVCGTPEVCDFEDNDCDQRVDEDFLEDGLYTSVDHCGGCGVACSAVFPTAAEVACEVVDGQPTCVLVACAPGFHLGGEGACVPDVPVLCLPCASDEECALRLPEARCYIEAGEREGRCLEPCAAEDGDACPLGFTCADDAGGGARLCLPADDGGDFCACTADNEGIEFGCLFRRDDGYECAGSQICLEEDLAACEPALSELCNLLDDDCDYGVDEDFKDDAGRYVSPLHCGACGQPCAALGSNVVAECVVDDDAPGGVLCVSECAEGFVDVDGIAANGCECELVDEGGPPISVVGDADCDGVVDDNDDYVYVTPTGDDANDGSLDSPKRTIEAALSTAEVVGRDVLIARGVYEGPVDLAPGVNLFGGYRADFRDRDLTLFPVLIEAGAPGEPALRCTSITVETRINGVTLEGADAVVSGQGSTAAYFDRCGPEVRLEEVTIFAGRGAPGLRGDDSSENLDDVGVASLADLDGDDGTSGGPGTSFGSCVVVSGGAGGIKSCDGSNVSGGTGGAAGCPDLGCNQTDACPNAGCTDYTSGGVCDIDAVLASAVPNPAPTPASGASPGASGDLSYNSPTNRQICNFCDDNPTLNRDGDRGGDGAAGADGIGGEGCHAAPSLDVATGRVRGLDGEDGGQGDDGSGGGGGSSGAGYAVIAGTQAGCFDRAGGSGGGGGSGGCGAPGANGGTGGGASVGVVVRLTGAASAGPTFESVRILTTTGGDGGDGGQGAGGGAPGVGAPGGLANFWCARNGGRGGDGGRGGAGGGGGGGCGGGSHAVYVDAETSVEAYRSALTAGIEVDPTGVPGRAGRGGVSPGRSGEDGMQGSGVPIFVAF